MNNNKKKNLSKYNIVLGYVLGITFIWLILFNLNSLRNKEANVILSREQLKPEVIEVNNTIIQEKIVYVDRSQDRITPSVEYINRLDDVIIEGKGEAIIIDGHNDLIIDDNIVYHNRQDKTLNRTHNSNQSHGWKAVNNNRNHTSTNDYDTNVEPGILERRLAEVDLADSSIYEEIIKKGQEKGKIGINKRDDELNFSKLTLAKDGDDFELGDIDSSFGDKGKGYGAGKGGELYAYNFPSKGIGAGVGSGGLGAAGGSGAGLGAGIGEGLLNGEVVPTLGGVGDGAKTAYGEPLQSSGVGGLVGGAGAGGAAGLTQGYITEKLGIGIGPGKTGGGYGKDYKHLPENGALHIMMHVDGSGSILNTRKKLEIMKNTLFKKALLPYYGNDESLYNKRVTIIDSSGERTLRFFNKATEKDNVLAIVFQDEAQPDYHLPNFNKRPEGHYREDLNKLKSNLNKRKGIYRGIMFQVGEKNFSRSFKEFVENAWQGEGYLKSENLKKYYWQDNKSNIEKKEGVVFSDEYHARSEGDPQYYMDLIFNAAKKIGIDLNSYEAGLTDGKKIDK